MRGFLLRQAVGIGHAPLLHAAQEEEIVGEVLRGDLATRQGKDTERKIWHDVGVVQCC